jgi:hypothetical protein
MVGYQNMSIIDISNILVRPLSRGEKREPEETMGPEIGASRQVGIPSKPFIVMAAVCQNDRLTMRFGVHTPESCAISNAEKRPVLSNAVCGSLQRRVHARVSPGRTDRRITWRLRRKRQVGGDQNCAVELSNTRDPISRLPR